MFSHHSKKYNYEKKFTWKLTYMYKGRNFFVGLKVLIYWHQMSPSKILSSLAENYKKVSILLHCWFFFKSILWTWLFSFLILQCKNSRAGNKLIGFPSKSLVFCLKMSEWAIHSFAHFWWATCAIRSQSLISSERLERIALGRSFLVSDLRDSLPSLTKKEEMSNWLIFQ